jgi:hypothetical protein
LCFQTEARALLEAERLKTQKQAFCPSQKAVCLLGPLQRSASEERAS